MKKSIWEPLTLWGVPTGSTERGFMGFRKRTGGERSKYAPHVGAKEIAKHDARERAMLEKAEGKYEGVYIV